MPQPSVTTSIFRCARCGGDHTKLEFKPFSRPPEEYNGRVWSHFALCPTNGEPILLAIQSQDAEAK